MLLGWPVLWFAGLLIVTLVPALLFWGWGFWRVLDDVRLTTLGATIVSYSAAYVLYQRVVLRFAVGSAGEYIFPLISSVFLIAVAILLFTRGAYSRPFLLAGYALSLSWFFFAYFSTTKFRKFYVAVVPVGRAMRLPVSKHFEFLMLNSPMTSLQGVNAVIVDLHAKELTADWEKFLTRCVLAQIPVLHVRHAYEVLTGRSPVEHLAENELGVLVPSPFYSLMKRLVDIVGVLVLAPVVFPIMLLTALAIKWNSRGPVFFKQSRVGQGNKDFLIYKFRSMYDDAECDGAKLAQPYDQRVTMVGRFLRKTRLDELPQLVNVLKGDMSLIGPRPEQRYFVNEFEQTIPFYMYRHVVKPGITGWAQVMQGYAHDADSTNLKIQYDFYYIKHFSLWLDILIVFKTIKTIVTGFGAR
jgi:lipopolysaccharide/colanic/teichoic acid biosynthesis glycosyltransferase